MKVAVLMVAYNATGFIGHALRSILRQQGHGLEMSVLVVNDGSTDATADVVRALGEHGVRLIETANQGVTAARNVALDHLPQDADLVTWLDADDLLPEGRLARDLGHFAEDRELDFVYGYSMLFREASDSGLEPAEGAHTQVVRGIQLGSGLYRQSFVRAIGGFDPALPMVEDADWLLRAFETSQRYRLLDDVCVYYRRHEGNMTRNRGVARRHFARVMLNSIRRRRARGGFDLPPGIFEGQVFLSEAPL